MGAEAVAGIALPEGDPEAIFDAAAGLGRLAGGFDQVAGSFRRAAAATPSWKGDAAEAARASLEGCARAADGSREACIGARVEVSRYAADFEEAHRAVKSLQREAEGVEVERDTARRKAKEAGARAQEAHGRVAQAMVAAPLDLGGVAMAQAREATRQAEQAEADQAKWTRRVEGLEDELRRLRERAQQQREAAREAEDRAEAAVIAAQELFPTIPAGAGPAGIPAGGGQPGWPFTGPLAPPGPLFGGPPPPSGGRDRDRDPPGGPSVPPFGGPFAGPLVPPGPLFGGTSEPPPDDDDGGLFDDFKDTVADAPGFALDRAEDASDFVDDRLDDTGDFVGDRADDAGDLIGGPAQDIGDRVHDILSPDDQGPEGGDGGVADDSGAFRDDARRDTGELTKNVEADLGVEKQPGEETHHLVPKGEYSNRSEAARQELHEAQARLQRFDIGADDGPNGVFLPKDDHRGIHTDRYFEALNDRLADARTREEALDAMRDIREEVGDGDFPH